MITRFLRTALATSLLVSLAQPSWSCGCLGHAPPSGAASSGQSGGSGGENSSSRGGSWGDTAAAEGAREGAAAGAAADLQGGEVGARTGGDVGQSAGGTAGDFTSQINALAQFEAQNPPPSGIHKQCADLRDNLRDLMTAQGSLQGMVDSERKFLTDVTEMTPDGLDAEEGALQQTVAENRNAPSAIAWRKSYIASQELDFLRSFRVNMGGPDPVQSRIPGEPLQASAQRIVAEQQAWADGQKQQVGAQIQSVRDQMADLGCDPITP
jgi:hypothetical protein